MELKFEEQPYQKIGEECSNRTFMELKLKNMQQYYDVARVLIVPLWNWNRDVVTFVIAVAEF